MQAGGWLAGELTVHKRGEFYFLTLTTLLGMYFMISAGNFLFFFIGLETASIPMATLVAFDKYRHKSAEAGAKYILNAVFASGLSLYGMSLLYGTTGTLYFDDIPATRRPVQRAADHGVRFSSLVGPVLQDFARAVPPVDAGRLRRCADDV